MLSIYVLLVFSIFSADLFWQKASTKFLTPFIKILTNFTIYSVNLFRGPELVVLSMKTATESIGYVH